METVIFEKDFHNLTCNKKAFKEILAPICALLNTNGGCVVLPYSDQTSQTHFFQMIEQSLMNSVDKQLLTLHIWREYFQDKIICHVTKSSSLITINTNLYVPSETQANLIPGNECIKDTILMRQLVPNPVLIGSHHRLFEIKQSCGFNESKNTEFKCLKAGPSESGAKLADRMTRKSNKFSRYVSAFANDNGGHIYFGIEDDRVVEGEKISNVDDISDITKKIEKAIKKMIWPEEIGQPKRGEHWEIFFEPVLDENSKPIPSTFVIVIYIAPCLGGVFTEEPECYEMVEGKVQKMSFFSWKKRILHPFWPGVDDGIPSTVKRITWSSPAVRNAFIFGGEKLRHLINNGQWDAFFKECEVLEGKSKSNDMKILVLLQIVKAHYRRGEFEKANESLDYYEKILPQTQNQPFFEVMKMYLNAALYRAEGNKDKLEIFLTGALEKAELIEPGLVTATVYTFAGSVTDLISSPENISPDILSIRALQHVKRSPHSGEDIHLDKKAHLNLATFHLGCNISGQPTKENVDQSCLDTAKASIMAIQKSVLEENPLSSYYEVQLNLVYSIYNYRRSQVSPDKKTRYLCNARDYVKKAERLAADCEFAEMLEWSKATRILCTK